MLHTPPPIDHPMSTHLQVANLPHGTNEAILRMAFGQNRRKVVSVDIVLDKRTGKATGSAFVNMASEADALAAIRALNGSDLDGRVLQVTGGKQRTALPERANATLSRKAGARRRQR
jgi:RNA recognition motif-containing protein